MFCLLMYIDPKISLIVMCSLYAKLLCWLNDIMFTILNSMSILFCSPVMPLVLLIMNGFMRIN